MPEGEEEEQDIEKLFQKIMKLLLLGKGNTHTSPGGTSPESPK